MVSQHTVKQFQYDTIKATVIYKLVMYVPHNVLYNYIYAMHIILNIVYTVSHINVLFFDCGYYLFPILICNC